MTPNGRVERPATLLLAACKARQLPVGNQGAAHDSPRSAPTSCQTAHIPLLAHLSLGQESLRRNETPSALEQFGQRASRNGRKSHQYPRIVSIVVGYEEYFGLSLNQDVSVENSRPQDKAIAILVESDKEFAANLECGRAIRCPVFDARQGVRNLSNIVKGNRATTNRSSPRHLARDWRHALSNDRVERPATFPVPRPDAAHHASRSAPTRC